VSGITQTAATSKSAKYEQEIVKLRKQMKAFQLSADQGHILACNAARLNEVADGVDEIF
jgi:hypothetical protein